MSNNLLLRLPLDAQSEVYWLSYGKEAKAIKVAEAGTLGSIKELSSLAEKAVNSRVTVLVPGEVVTLRSLNVHGRLTHLVKKSLPYRLEDDINGDVDDMHVAIFDKTGETLQLGLVEHRWMELWTDWLTEAGIKSRQWLPDSLMLPWQEGQCSLMQIAGHWLVRHDQWQSACCDANWLSLFINGLETSESLESVDYTLADNSPLVPLLKQVNNSHVNLLQERWQVRSEGRGQLKTWRTSMILAGVLACSWLGHSMLTAWQLNQQADQLQQKSRMIYQTLFPDERIIRLVPQLNRKLRELETAQQPDEGILQQLEDLAPIFSQYADIKPLMISYDDSRQILRITAEANSMTSFTGMRDSVAEDHEVSLESLEQNGQKTTGVVVIKGEDS